MKKVESILYHVSEQKKKTIYDFVDEYVSEKYDIRFNEISHEFQISIKESNTWEDFEVNSLLIELAKSNIEINPGKLDIYLRSNLISRFNPIAEYFEKLPKWVGGDHIRNLASFLPTKEPEQFLYHLRKWLVRTVKGALEKNYFNKQCLVLVHSEQNSGKSTWCRFLCPPALSRYFAEDMNTDKDARSQLTRNFIINLDELSVLARREINALKAYFSKTMINERLPYDRKNSILRRTCSFIGSTNRATFLNDETGSVRWLCFELIGKIDFAYSREIDIDKVWAQAYYLAYVDEQFCPELTLEDIVANDERNKTYREASMEEELLAKYYLRSSDPADFKTASDIVLQLNCINPRLNMYYMGRALKALNYERVKQRQGGIYGYLIKPRFKTSPLEI
ncbi:VapE domain-containing protein [Salegentibacter salegens]|uniref:Virulence-associated protein E n=1 Tax=Salegentibacter salegens TaxID=143223 RepID=A0A1M7K989_9FLAO|nr:VapE domain-containing protein [Salegentibacter salegens]PRX44399.1 virulence-associated protein E [Salegentibacter salegens]SHM61798.1 Virulence-associated protein E [Salegentibacter salegens]